MRSFKLLVALGALLAATAACSTNDPAPAPFNSADYIPPTGGPVATTTATPTPTATAEPGSGLRFEPVVTYIIGMSSSGGTAKQDVQLSFGSGVKAQSVLWVSDSGCEITQYDLAIPFYIKLTNRTAPNPVGVAYAMKVDGGHNYRNPTTLFLGAATSSCQSVSLTGGTGVFAADGQDLVTPAQTYDFYTSGTLSEGQYSQLYGAFIVKDYYKGTNEKPHDVKDLFVEIVAAESYDEVVYQPKTATGGMTAWRLNDISVVLPVDGKTSPCDNFYDALRCKVVK